MRLVTAALLTALMSGGAVADEPAVPEHFKPLAFLVGHCWKGTFPDGANTDEHCFEWMFGTTFIRDRHVVRGSGPDYRGETIYAFRPDQDTVGYTYWASNGGMSAGEMVVDGDRIVFPAERYVSDGGEQTLRSIWQRTGPDRYRVVTETLDGTRWVEAWHMELIRSGPATTGSR